MFRKYGWKKDKKDPRDLLYRDIKPVSITLPDRVDLRAICSPVEDQGDLGSCTANALVGNLEFLERKSNVKFWDISRLFIYYNERVIEDTISEDNGAELRDGIKSLVTYGYCSEKRVPYVTSKFTRKPSCIAYKEAKKHTIQSYHSIMTLNEMLVCLAEGYPFVFGFTVYEGFESDEVKQSGILNMPGQAEQEVGGHAVCAVGYDQAAKRFIVRNSWGPDWGQGGYFTMPFEYMEKLANDFWTIRK